MTIHFIPLKDNRKLKRHRQTTTPIARQSNTDEDEDKKKRTRQMQNKERDR